MAEGDVNGDGTTDIIVAAGAGGGPEVKVIEGTKLSQTVASYKGTNFSLLNNTFSPFDPSFLGGVFVG